MTGGDLLIGDWGTTRLRMWRVRDGVAAARRDFALGVARLAAGEAAARFEREVRPTMGGEGLPTLFCGMVGSTLGWTAVPYVDCPASVAALASGLAVAAPDVWIAPGVRGEGPVGPEVMRGEETQVMGWLAADPRRASGRRLLCHPGTHAKWIAVEDGAIIAFATAMTGELFAVLTAHSVLATAAEAEDEAAFDAGVDAAGDGGGLSTRLFGARARAVLGELAAGEEAAFLSGLLIGSEVGYLTAAMRGDGPRALDLIGAARLRRWYRRALERRGWTVAETDGEAASVAGLMALWEHARP